MTKARDLANIISGGFTADDIPNLDTAKLTTGTIASARIDNNSLSAITALPSGVGGIALQSVQTTSFTAVAGRGYPCNTTSAGFTVTLPATPSAGDQVQLVDYAGTFDTNQLIINPNGEDLEGSALNLALTGEREGIILTYIDSTQGWIATSGINEGTDALSPVAYLVDFLVIAGGGGAGGNGTDNTAAGGGGAGGYRNSFSNESSGGGGSSEASLSFLPGVVYTITVGAGGAGGGTAVDSNAGVGTVGLNSEISGTGITTIISTGGGGGACSGGQATGSATSGGSGGGCNQNKTSQGSGTANQGFAGAKATGDGGGGGGGGASQTPTANSTNDGGVGGNGLASSITGSSVSRGGGGGGGNYGASGGTGGTGGGGNANTPTAAGSAGTVNTGGGGGAGRSNTGASYTGGAGGKGVVILRMPDGNYSSTTTGSPTVNTNVGGSGETVIIFNDSGSITG